MSGSHMAHSSPNQKSSGSWKIVVLVLALVIALAALAFLLYTLFSGGTAGGGGTADIAPGIFTQVEARNANDKNISGNIAVTQSTLRPATIPADAQDVVLLDFDWKDASSAPDSVYLTVSDPSFTNGDGLTVHQYDETTGQWDVLGSYRIENNAVTFQTASLTPFAFQVVSATAPAASPVPSVSPEPTFTPEPSPTPTPEPVAVVDYGSYPNVQSGVFTLADDFSDGHTYVVALVENMVDGQGSAADDTADEAEGTEGTEESSDGVSIAYVNAPEASPETGAAAPAAEDPNAPKAYVLMNMNGTDMQTVEMPLHQTADGVWYLGGPITDGMLWKATRDSYKDDYRFSLQNNGRFINIDESEQHMILDDNNVRTRWLVQDADISDTETISTLNYRDGDRFYITSMGMSYVALNDQAFPAGTLAEGATVSSPTYLGTEAPVDQTLVNQVMSFTVSKEESQAKQVVIFELDQDMAVPSDVVTLLAHRVTVPIIDQNSNLSLLDIRDGEKVLQLGVDYTVAARVYNNSTVVVVISFIGEYSGQIVRTYPGTYFRTDEAQPTVTPEPTATPEPTKAPGWTGGGGGGGGSTSNDDATDLVDDSSPTDG